jgi:hypothetical protein
MEEIREIYRVPAGPGLRPSDFRTYDTNPRPRFTSGGILVLPGAHHRKASNPCREPVAAGEVCPSNVPWYIGTMEHDEEILIERVQTGVRMEKRLLKVLKAFAEYHDLTLGDLLEGIVLHAFDGKTPFNQGSRNRIKELKRFYGLELDSRASHRLRENQTRPRASR